MNHSSPNQISVSFDLSERDFYRAGVAILIGGSKTLRFILWCGVIMFVLSGAAFVSGSSSTLASEAKILFGPSVLALAIVFFATYVGPYFRSKSVYKNNMGLQNTIRCTFSADGVTQKTATGQGKTPWTDFKKARETREWFVLYAQKGLACPVPTRAFADDEEIAAFREMLRGHIRKVSLRG